MSTDYTLACYTCQCSMPTSFASGSGFHGYKVWEGTGMLEWLGHGQTVGTHEGHDLRIVSEHVDLPWEYGPDGEYLGERHTCPVSGV